MMPPLRFVVIGLGGYAAAHMNAVEWLAQQGLAQLTGVVALESDRQKFPERVRKLQTQGVHLFESIADFFARGVENADVLTVPIGIHQHASASIAAMRAGLHAYCEKPLAATVQECEKVIAARDATRRKIAVGFQHIYSHSIRQLKARICAGRLGRVRAISLMCGWPRSIQYYSRNEWAGKIRVGEHWVWDSPANNAHAHHLLNVLYLACSQEHAAALPIALRAELYCANPLASCDTAQLQFQTGEGARCHVLLTHANARELGPVMQLDCENGKVEWQSESGETIISYSNGARERFNNEGEPQWRYAGFRDLVYAIHNDISPLCTLETARCHTATIAAMHASCPEITAIPKEYIDVVRDWEAYPPNTKGDFHRVRGLDHALQSAFERGVFLNELEKFCSSKYKCKIQVVTKKAE